jgi:hypothetical protein
MLLCESTRLRIDQHAKFLQPTINMADSTVLAHLYAVFSVPWHPGHPKSLQRKEDRAIPSLSTRGCNRGSDSGSPVIVKFGGLPTKVQSGYRYASLPSSSLGACARVPVPRKIDTCISANLALAGRHRRWLGASHALAPGTVHWPSIRRWDAGFRYHIAASKLCFT